MTEPDEDAAWRSIVENYGERAVLDPAPDPVENTEQRYQPEQGLLSGADADERDVLDAWDDPEDRFVPPEPEPMPRPEPPRLLAWAGVLGVPVLTIVFTVAHVYVPTWVTLLAVAWFVGGFGYLVATMRKDDEDDDWDDGAVI